LETAKNNAAIARYVEENEQLKEKIAELEEENKALKEALKAPAA
jgi:cell division septum initiation protein DivIVA